MASDCLSVVKAVTTTEQNLGSYHHVLEEIKKGVVCFSDALIVHENRASNKESHDLARLVLSLGTG